MNRPEWETVIGLEIHAELNTKTKLFCSCANKFGEEPNRNICPICLAHPGTMPSLNREAVRLAVIAAEALGCEVQPVSAFDRKHYFYPDLPKAYQITQFDRPIALGGGLEIHGKKFRLTRIHIEEDAGKLFHEGGKTGIDYNRAGVPLIEIVTEPDFRSAAEASEFCKKLRSILLFAGVSKCKMNEGNLRFDVNLSVHRKGEPFGQRTEIKNLNSFRFMEKAIQSEEKRQIALLSEGKQIVRETRRFDEGSGETYPMRKKEEAADYRFLPEPDLPPLVLSDGEIAGIRAQLPPLPDELSEEWQKIGVMAQDCERILQTPETARCFGEILCKTDAKALCGMLFASLSGNLPKNKEEFARLSTLCEKGKLSKSDAKVLAFELCERDFSAEEEIRARGMETLTDRNVISGAVSEVLAANPKLISDYKGGKTALFGVLLGMSLKKTGGKADPNITAEVLKALLEE